MICGKELLLKIGSMRGPAYVWWFCLASLCLLWVKSDGFWSRVGRVDVKEEERGGKVGLMRYGDRGEGIERR